MRFFVDEVAVGDATHRDLQHEMISTVHLLVVGLGVLRIREYGVLVCLKPIQSSLVTQVRRSGPRQLDGPCEGLRLPGGCAVPCAPLREQITDQRLVHLLIGDDHDFQAAFDGAEICAHREGAGVSHGLDLRDGIAATGRRHGGLDDLVEALGLRGAGPCQHTESQQQPRPTRALCSLDRHPIPPS